MDKLKNATFDCMSSWDTGMVASSSLLHAVRHCTEALVYSNFSRGVAASMCLAIISGLIASSLPWFLCSTAVPIPPLQVYHVG